MNEYREPAELLSESDIISEEEKLKIIDEIDKSFLSKSENESSLSQIAAKSNGLVLPIAVATIAIISTIAVLVIFNTFLWKNNKNSAVSVVAKTSNSEWELLKTYMQESTKKLDKKNSEIKRYKVEIVDYDRRLSTLRKLIDIKREIEQKLVIERRKLQTEGISGEKIASKITVLEKKLISNLSPGMIAFYNLGVDDLNMQIDQILSKKTISEQKLESSLTEQKVLIDEKQKIQNEINVKKTDSPLPPAIIDTMTTMKDKIAHYKDESIIQNQVINSYNRIFQNLGNSKYNKALKEVEVLKNILQNNTLLAKNTLAEQLPVQSKTLDAFKNYINKNILMAELSKSNRLQYEEINKKMASLVTKDKQKSNQNIESPLPTIIQNADNPGELILLGVVSLIQFDRINIETVSGIDVENGTEFYVFKRGPQKNAIELGRGAITDVSAGLISGQLDWVQTPSRHVEVDDFIYIKPNTKK